MTFRSQGKLVAIAIRKDIASLVIEAAGNKESIYKEPHNASGSKALQ